MTRLLVFAEAYDMGGASRYMIDVCNAAAPHFESVTLVMNPGGLLEADEARLEFSPDVRLVRIVTPSGLARANLGHPGVARRVRSAARKHEQVLQYYNYHLLKSLVRRVRPGLTLSMAGGYPGARSTGAAVRASVSEGVPAALSIVGLSKEIGEPSTYERGYDRMMIEGCDFVLTNAQAVADSVRRYPGFGPGQMEVVHNALPYREATRRRDASPVVRIGCVGRLEIEKGFMDLVDAVGRMNATDSVQVELYGSGGATDELRRAVADRSLQDRVNIRGEHAGDVHDALADLDIYVLPSYSEGLPYGVLEAMRAGLAIVATNVGGIPEALEDEVSALLVEPGNPAMLAERLSMLVGNPELRERLGSAARDRFVQEFTIEKMRTSFAKVLERRHILQQGASRVE